MVARTPESVRLQILALAASGHSQRQICRRLNVSKSTVQRTLAAAAEQHPTPMSPPEAPPPPARPIEGGGRALVEDIVAKAETIHSQALRDDPAVAGRAVVDLADATAIGARVDQIEVQPGVWMTMREIHDGMTGIYQRARELAAEHEAEHGPTRCQGCGVHLQMAPVGENVPVLVEAPSEPEQANPALARAKQTYDMAGASIDTALEDGNLRAAQRANRARTNVARVYVREELRDRQRKAEGAFFFPVAETTKSLEKIHAQMAALAAVPLMCTPCLSAHRMHQTIGVVSAAE